MCSSDLLVFAKNSSKTSVNEILRDKIRNSIHRLDSLVHFSFGPLLRSLSRSARIEFLIML